jgi:hypothetical protein
MLRIAASLAALPLLLVLLLAAAMEVQSGKLGLLTVETFELGIVPAVLLTALVVLTFFAPLVLLASRFGRLTIWRTVAAGVLSALMPVLISNWSVLVDSKLHLRFRAEQLAGLYPLLAMGAIGGLLFWLLAIFRNSKLSRQST